MVKDRLDYDPESGQLTWRFNPARSVQWNGRYAGKPAGHFNDHGYISVRLLVDGRKILFQAHRLIWFWFYGEWPADEIDHINGNRRDNSIANLREATRAQNAANTSAHADSKSGVKGVRYCPLKKNWVAKIMVGGRRISCGSHETREGAIAARKAAEQSFQQEFARAS